jgi:NADPH:quinone reductase-like Zn-dependent oxidoreductase
MRVVRLRAPGGPEQLAVEEADRPQPGPGEALVRVHAAAITRGELDWPVDRLPAIPSYELSGVVEEVGPGVASVAAGDEVFALTPYDRDGVAADYTAVPAEHLVAKPRALGHAESAAIPLPALSAWQGLFDHGRLGAGERVLIHGAAGSVGGYAVQFARAAGAHVIGTASAASLDLVLALGAHEAVDAATRFEDAVEPVDVVFETAGGARLRRSFAVLGAGGRLISVAEEPPDGGVYFIVEPNRDQLTSTARLADAGQLRPRPSTSSRSRQRARRSRAASSRADRARSCWPSPASIRTEHDCPADDDRRDRDPRQRARPRGDRVRTRSLQGPAQGSAS